MEDWRKCQISTLVKYCQNQTKFLCIHQLNEQIKKRVVLNTVSSYRTGVNKSFRQQISTDQ